MPPLSLQHWCGDRPAFYHLPWLIPPILSLKLLPCLTFPINVSESRQTTLLFFPSTFHGIEPGALAAPGTLTSPAKDNRAGAREDTFPSLCATPVPWEGTKGCFCTLVRVRAVLGDARTGTQPQPGSNEPGAALAAHEEQQEISAELRIKHHSSVTRAARADSVACAPRERAVCSELTR